MAERKRVKENHYWQSVSVLKDRQRGIEGKGYRVSPALSGDNYCGKPPRSRNTGTGRYFRGADGGFLEVLTLCGV